MISSAGMIFCATAALAGGTAGGVFFNNDVVKNHDSTLEKTTKIAAGIFFGAVVAGGITLGVTLIVSKYGLLIGIPIIALIIFRGLKT